MNFTNNQIFISLIKNNNSLLKNNSLIKFPYNLLADTSEGVVSELTNEIDLTPGEVVELKSDLNNLGKLALYYI